MIYWDIPSYWVMRFFMPSLKQKKPIRIEQSTPSNQLFGLKKSD